MNVPIDLKNLATVSVAYSPASVTADGDGTSIDLKEYTGNVLLIVNCGAATAGTNPTMDFIIKDSADNSSFAAVSDYSAAFTQVTTVAGVQTYNIDTRKVRRYARLSTDIGGTSSPAFPLSAVFVGVKKVVGTTV